MSLQLFCDDGAALDAATGAIASLPRRVMVERLAEGPATVSELTELLGMSVPATLKNLDRLVAGGLVTRHQHGRTVTVTLVPGGLDGLVTWALSTRLFWNGQLDALADHLADPHTEEQSP